MNLVGPKAPGVGRVQNGVQDTICGLYEYASDDIRANQRVRIYKQFVVLCKCG